MRALIAVLCLLLALGARAEPIAGQADPRFQAALAIWLAASAVSQQNDLRADFRNEVMAAAARVRLPRDEVR